MYNIFSIEPLSIQQIKNIESHTSCKVIILQRDFYVSCELMPNIEVLIARDRDNIEKIVEVCPNLKLLFIVSTGVEKIPFKILQDRGVLVANTGGINNEIMSEYVLGYILADSVRIEENLKNQALHHWKKYQCVDSLNGRTILIVGAGRVGMSIAQKTKCFGMTNIGVKRQVQTLPYFDEMDSLDNLYNILPKADYVVCCLPLTQYTNKIIDDKAFSCMKASAMFINISRGACVNEHDLINALNQNKIRKAVLDVFYTEPLSTDNSLWDTPNLLISPHSSGRLENFMDEAINYFISNYNAFVNGLELPNKVDLINGY